MQYRRVDRADLQFDVAGVTEFLRQRDVLPAESRRAHVDLVEVGRGPLPAIDDAGAGLEGQRVLAGGGEFLAGNAAHAVAAGLRFRTVTVEDADERVGAMRARRI